MARSLKVAALAFSLVAAATLAVAWAAGEATPFVQNEPRAMSRVVYFGKAGLVGEYAVQYGKPTWQAAYDTDFDKMTRGKRMRLGKDWWTTLDTFCPLTFGEKTDLADGAYFLVLECSDQGAWSLVALDPAPIRKAKMDAFGSAKTTGGTAIPLTYEASTEAEPELKIQFLAVEGKPGEQTLEIRFGKHRLSTRVVPKI
ncbi:MAG: hypothetical protein K8T90_10925 [Planctomycetes bacterium]|nr:hypothetical protein [Planctomycetota bacterium]